MKKAIILILTIILMSTLVIGIDQCDDEPSPNTLCYMRTPSLSNCTTYNYTIFQNNGSIINQSNLTIFNQDIYELNFSQRAGQYIIRLCDGTTREIFVGDKANMAWISITLLIIAMTIFLGIGSFKINDKKLRSVKITFFILFIVNTLLLGVYAYVISQNPSDASSFTNIGLGYAGINIIIILGFIIAYSLKIFGGVYKKQVDGMSQIFKSK